MSTGDQYPSQGKFEGEGSDMYINGPTDTVYAHVERTVHALLDAITASLPAAIDPAAGEGTLTPDGIKILAEAVQTLSASSLAFTRNPDRYPPACSCGATVFRAMQHHAPDCSGHAYFGPVTR